MSERAFDALVIVEGSGRPELETVLGQIERTVLSNRCGLSHPASLVHNLAYQLSARDLVRPDDCVAS
jgi:hypothetical protein